jgi:hypothetical protein
MAESQNKQIGHSKKLRIEYFAINSKMESLINARDFKGIIKKEQKSHKTEQVLLQGVQTQLTRNGPNMMPHANS